jgi:sugar-specific transcriptional regulator TrmB
MKNAFNYHLLDLEPRDIRIYESLLDHEAVTSIRNVSSWTKLNRGVVFNSINKLVELGLISAYMRGKQKRYYANDPSILKTLMTNKIETLNIEKHSIDAYIIELKQKGKQAVPPQFAALYEGEEEIATILYDVLATVSKLDDKSYCSISSSPIRGYLYKKFPNFKTVRASKGIYARVLRTGSAGEPTDLSEVRVLPDTRAKDPACYIIIYGSKVAQISLDENLVPYGIVTNNVELARLQRIVFDQLWQQLPRAA